jgi:hypothetical protein
MKWWCLCAAIVTSCGRTAPMGGRLEEGDERTPAAPPADATPPAQTCEATIPACGTVAFEPLPEYGCGWDEPSEQGRVIAAIATHRALYLVRNGELQAVEVHRFSLVSVPEARFVSPRVIARGDWIAAAVASAPPGAGEVAYELVIVDKTGRRVFHELERALAASFDALDRPPTKPSSCVVPCADCTAGPRRRSTTCSARRLRIMRASQRPYPFV